MFAAGMSRKIETNNRLRSRLLTGLRRWGSMSSTSNRTYSLNPTINIMGGDDPRAIAVQIRRDGAVSPRA
ncbi:hypothetical protein B2M20_17640 [Nitrobacter vulgaris]|uniref:Uncharacterized protein n=1 Tax=Nitrobacter vulgaris TaxID=29421 RepID=A0A1V4HU13_NITVU|nr:hypothetical protein B2M20_17640 [Nitrobacter vulgaris]